MASILKVDELQGIATAKTVTVTVGASVTQSLEQGLAKSWQRTTVTSGTPALIESLNTASVIDNGVGDYTYNFMSNMSSATYAAAGNVNEPAGVSCINNATGFGVSGYRVYIHNHANTNLDGDFVSNCMFGDLA